MIKTLKDKHLVVVGGSSGIGLNVAAIAAAEGAEITISGLHQDRLDTAKEILIKKGAQSVTTYAFDAHNHDDLEAFFNKVGGFDFLVSMIGDVMGGGFLSADMDTIRHVMESKLFTNIRIGQLAAKHINQGGCIVFTSGTGGRAQDACASYLGNLGINALVEGLAVELAPKARVNAVSPTWTHTTFWRDMPEEQLNSTKAYFEGAIPMGRLAEIEELAETYIYHIKNGFITGQHIAVDGGIMLKS